MSFNVLVLASALFAVGCTESGSLPADDVGADDVGIEGDFFDQECPPGTTLCPGGCVDISDDRENCGACGNGCAPAEVCTDGECALECPPDEVECSDRCVDIDSDFSNCGGCGLACTPGEVCNRGDCQTTCDDGLTDCGGSCVNLSTDANHCGDCAVSCDAGEVCSSGECAGSGCGDGLCSGSEGETPCTCSRDCGACSGCCRGETCNPGTSMNACGEGGEECDRCTEGELCSEGSCTCPGTPCDGECCPSSDPVCAYHASVGHSWCTSCNPDACGAYGAICCPDSDDCIAQLSDESNCGGCGTVCASGQYCAFHASVGHAWCTPCNPDACAVYGAICCPSSNDCIAQLSDESNCGGCGTVCASGQYCAFHASVGHAWCTPCNPDACAVYGAICCPDSNDCINPWADGANCGGCDIQCGTDEQCISGLCQ